MARRSSADVGCLFCRIVRGEEPASIVWRDDDTVVFLDSHPVFKGHALVVPSTHYDTLVHLPPERIGPLYRVVQRVAEAVLVAHEADGTFVAQNNVVSQSVPHVHVHVVPRRRKDGLRGFFWPRQRYTSDEERDEHAARLAQAMADLK